MGDLLISGRVKPVEPRPVPGLIVAPNVGAPVAIEFSKVGKRFDIDGRIVDALVDLSLSVHRGEIFGVIGRSGAGKSTLLRLINGLETPSRGEVRVGGECVGSLDHKQMVGLRRRTGMIFQHFNLLAAKTALENVMLPLLVAGVAKAQARARAQELLDLVGLAGKDSSYPSQLSGGQKQRVGIARALVHKPDLLLCDEATSALDSESTEAVLALLRRIREQMGLTIVLITHQLEVVQAICDRVGVMEHGRLTCLGDTWEVLGKPRSRATDAAIEVLPPILAQRFCAIKPATAHRLLVSVHFDGQQALGVELAALLTIAPDAHLVHGGVQDIQGRSIGTLLLSVEPGQEPISLIQRMRKITPFAEVVGYVRTDV